MKQWKWVTIFGSLSVRPQNVTVEVKEINSDKSAPTGDSSINYPQISIRTNRTPERTNLDEIIQWVDDTVAQFPFKD